MPETTSSILDELEASLASGNVQHRLNVLQRVTDLFVAGSSRYSGVEIALFDIANSFAGLTVVASTVDVSDIVPVAISKTRVFNRRN